VVGLYLDPPAYAVVLSIDEKSQIQALDRTQPGLPMKKGRCATMTHDYKRHGTTTLFAALDILEGKVIGRSMQRHRHQEFIRFLNTVAREVAADKAVHVVLDNDATHKHPRVTAWLQRHARFTFHFTPTSCSWANAVEGWFAKLTRHRLKRGVFTSIVELQTAINHFIADANAKPKPFVWTKSADAILAAVNRARQALEAIHSHVRPQADMWSSHRGTFLLQDTGCTLARVGPRVDARTDNHHTRRGHALVIVPINVSGAGDLAPRSIRMADLQIIRQTA
jgi:transposase